MDCFLTEEETKKYVNDYFVALGYKTTVAWGHYRGADIIAQNSTECKIIEVKGCGSRPQMRVNYFLSMLGEILQRMDNEKYQYYIALPKIKQYENLWQRFPLIAKRRTQIKLILVDSNGELEFLE